MTDEEIQAIKARADAATPGPWVYHAANPKRAWGGYAIWSAAEGLNLVTTPAVVEAYVPQLTADIDQTGVLREQDADFIAGAREDIPALLAEVEQWREIGRMLANFNDNGVPDGAYKCHWCAAMFDGIGVNGDDPHAPDCPVAKARALLGLE